MSDGEHHAVIGDRFQRSLYQLQRARIGPVHVLEQDDGRQRLCKPHGLLLKRSHGLLAALVRAHVRDLIVVFIEGNG